MPSEASSSGDSRWAPDRELKEWHDRHRVSPLDPADLRHAEMQRRLDELAATAGGRLALREVGKSHEGRSLRLASLGDGPITVFLWSQMHGDESTHTAVLLDLLSALTKDAENPLAREILEGCTLHMLPMLNPDGAERQIRFNAQGIDINRDARRLVTPEGRTLKQIVEELKPQFGFNLHNQNARTTVAHSHRVASVAVLAPPVDAVESTPPHVATAMRLALLLYNTSERWLPGHAARYDADYMPTAFGEWVQIQGAATVLLEGGGWPERDPAPMVSHHFGLVVEALRAIAAGTLEGIDPEPYRQLPRCGGRLYDWLLQGTRVAGTPDSEPRPADLAVNFARGHRLTSRPLDRGVLEDMGDLAGEGAREVVTLPDSVVLPLGVRYRPEITPTRLPTRDEQARWLANGWGAVVGRAELNNTEHLAAIVKMGPPPFAPRVGFVLDLGHARLPFTATEWERWNAYRQWGVVAGIADSSTSLPAEGAGIGELPLVMAEKLVSPEPATWHDMVTSSLRLARILKLKGFEGIERGSGANWLLVRDEPDFTWQQACDARRIEGVVVDGCRVRREDSTPLPPGRWLTPQGL